MEKIKITFLGTGSAIPTTTRNHTSIHFRYKEENFLIDCGEGTQRQIRKAKINPCKITRLLITHFHGDHVFGIPGLFQTLKLNGYNKTLEVYGVRGIKKFIGDIFKTFISTKSIDVKVRINEISVGRGESKLQTVFETTDFLVSALPLEHGIPTLGFIFQEKNKLRINKGELKKLKIKSQDKKRLQRLTKGEDIVLNNKKVKYKDITYLEKGRKIAFVLDTELCSNVKRLAQDADVLICESTFLNNPQYKHFSVKQAAEIAKKSNVKQLVLTHLSQRYEYEDSVILKQAKKIFPKSRVAKDFMILEV